MADEPGNSMPSDDNVPASTGADVDATYVDRSFSQADVDRIVKDRIARVKATPPDDYDDLKAAAERLAELEQAQQSELEKAQARAEAAEKHAQKIEADARETRLRSSILAEAAKQGRRVVDAEAAVALIDKSALELADDGTPTNIAEAMDSLLEQKPWLVAADGGSRPVRADQGARDGGKKQLSREQLQTMSHEDIVKAQKEGRLDVLLKGAS